LPNGRFAGGDLTVEIHPIKVGGGLEKMVQDDLRGEYMAIDMYKQYITLAEKEGDPVTRRMFEETLATEEGHANDWETVLGK
jgi:bacterioferritin (cytochrome b1)